MFFFLGSLTCKGFLGCFKTFFRKRCGFLPTGFQWFPGPCDPAETTTGASWSQATLMETQPIKFCCPRGGNCDGHLFFCGRENPPKSMSESCAVWVVLSAVRRSRWHSKPTFHPHFFECGVGTFWRKVNFKVLRVGWVKKCEFFFSFKTKQLFYSTRFLAAKKILRFPTHKFGGPKTRRCFFVSRLMPKQTISNDI